MPDTKRCGQHYKYFPKETEMRSVKDFHKKERSPDGLQGHCKWCVQQQHKESNPKSNAKLRLRMIAETGKPKHVTKFEMEQRLAHQAEVARLRAVVAEVPTNA